MNYQLITIVFFLLIGVGGLNRSAQGQAGGEDPSPSQWAPAARLAPGDAIKTYRFTDANSEWEIRNQWSDQRLGSSVTREGGEFFKHPRVLHRAWGKRDLWLISSNVPVRLIKDQHYALNLRLRNDRQSPVTGIELALIQGWDEHGPTGVIQTVAASLAPTAGDEEQQVQARFVAASDGTAYLALRLKWQTMPATPAEVALEAIDLHTAPFRLWLSAPSVVKNNTTYAVEVEYTSVIDLELRLDLIDGTRYITGQQVAVPAVTSYVKTQTFQITIPADASTQGPLKWFAKLLPRGAPWHQFLVEAEAETALYAQATLAQIRRYYDYPLSVINPPLSWGDAAGTQYRLAVARILPGQDGQWHYGVRLVTTSVDGGGVETIQFDLETGVVERAAADGELLVIPPPYQTGKLSPYLEGLKALGQALSVPSAPPTAAVTALADYLSAVIVELEGQPIRVPLVFDWPIFAFDEPLRSTDPGTHGPHYTITISDGLGGPLGAHYGIMVHVWYRGPMPTIHFDLETGRIEHDTDDPLAPVPVIVRFPGQQGYRSQVQILRDRLADAITRNLVESPKGTIHQRVAQLDRAVAYLDQYLLTLAP